jgi:uncharacterized membrane protein
LYWFVGFFVYNNFAGFVFSIFAYFFDFCGCMPEVGKQQQAEAYHNGGK